MGPSSTIQPLRDTAATGIVEVALETTLSTLEEDIQLCVPQIQDAFAQALESRLGLGGPGITAISRELGLHRKLAWQVRSAAYAPDPLRAVAFIPARAGIDLLTDSLRETSPEIASRLVEAFDRFEDLVRVHAGDRDHLRKLVESNPAASERDSEAKWREKAFLGNSFIWGVQARTQHSLSLLNISEDCSDSIDIVQVRGLIGLQRVRPNTRWVVGQSATRGSADDTTPHRTPLDPEGASETGGVPIIRDFCSRPLSTFERRTDDQGLVNDEILSAPVGSVGQQTIYTGEVIRKLASRYRNRDGQRALFGAISRTPSEVFVYDHFVHKDLFPGVHRELCVFSELNSPVAQDDSDLLPISESIQHLGRGMNVARTPDVPGYQSMLEYVYQNIGWQAEDFDLYRIRIEYPPMPATVVIRHELLAPVGESL